MDPFIIFSIIIPLAPLLVSLFIYFYNAVEHKNSQHYKQTAQAYHSVRFNKGTHGEYRIYKALKTYEDSGAKFLFNVYVPSNEKFTEIDVIMISHHGIFVFESKNYSGWIFGGINQKTWVQTFPNHRGGSDKYKFYNPVMQNLTHVNFLQDYLDKDIPLKSVIVFANSCTFKVVNNMADLDKNTRIVKLHTLPSTMDELYLSSEVRLSDAEINDLYEQLFTLTQISENTKSEHTKYVEAVKNEPPRNTYGVQMFCPLCGHKIVMRTAKHGANAGQNFYGCSNYPNCKYTRNI